MPLFLKKITSIVFLCIVSYFLNATNSNSDIYYEDDKIKIQYSYFNCDYQQIFDQEFVFLKITNKTSKKIKVNWQEELWYDNKCVNCETSNQENRKTIILMPEEIKESDCYLIEMPKIFSKFSEELSKMPGVKKIVSLSNFSLNNITITYVQ